MGAGDFPVQLIDVSKWQATTPSLSGIDGLIARSGIGTKPDAMYTTHIAAAKKAGIVTGSYWYGIGSLSVSDEVNAYIAREGDVDLHVLDWEGADGFTSAQARQFISLYRQRTGSKIALYASESRFIDLGQDWNWIANYSREPSKQFDMWQYGPLHGADGNVFNGTLDELHTLAGKGSTMTPAPITDKAPKFIDTKAGNYYDLDGTVRSGGHDAALNVLSPYGVGSKRAIFAGTAGSVIVLVIPTAIRPVTADCDAAVAAAKLEQSKLDASQIAGLTSQVAGLQSDLVAAQAAITDAASTERERIALAEAARVRAL